MIINIGLIKNIIGNMNKKKSSNILRKINNCGHYFHATCVEQWFQNHANCPVCRTNI